MAILNLISTVYSPIRGLFSLWLSLLLAVWRFIFTIIQKVKTHEKSASETFKCECKIFSPNDFLVDFSLNYHDIMVKSLSAYFTPYVCFSWIFRPKVRVCITNDYPYTQLRIMFSKLRYFIVNNYADIWTYFKGLFLCSKHCYWSLYCYYVY